MVSSVIAAGAAPPLICTSTGQTTRGARGVGIVRAALCDPIPDGSAWPLEHSVVASVAWCVAILVIVVPLTVRAYRNRTTN